MGMDVLDLLSKGDCCVQDEPAFCVNDCPLHVDARSMVEKLRSGDFRGAYKLYRRNAVFPAILSHTCEQPCLARCPRYGLGGSVSLRLLERACVSYGSSRLPQYAIPSQSGRVAVVGGGLCGLSCAITLARRGYSVELFEAGPALGGTLRDLPEDILPRDVLERELSEALEEERLSVHLNCKISDPAGLGDAVLLATGLPADGKTRDCDPVSLESSGPGVFLAGKLVLGDGAPIPGLIAHGLQAARSIERFLKGASLTSGRESEVSAVPTKLRVDASGILPENAVAPTGPLGGYTKEDAQKEALRCIGCECRVCVRACEFLRFYRMDPKQMTHTISKSLNAVELLNEKIATRMSNSCNHCELCGKLCPTGLDMGEICMDSKHILCERGELPPSFHDYWLRDMDAAWSEDAFLMLPREGAVRYLFFPGCQLGASSPGYVSSVWDYLREHMGESQVGLLLACCGAPAEWAGYERRRSEVIARLRDCWRSMGEPTLLFACPTCLKTFDRFLPEASAGLLYDKLLELGLPEGAAADKGAFSIFDPCAGREYPALHEAARALAAAAGARVEELPFNRETAKCCGHGGLIYGANPTLAQEIYQNRADASSMDYLTYCANCRDIFAAQGKRALHLLELVFPDSRQDNAPPTLSQRRENRRELKYSLSRTHGGPVEPERRPHETLSLALAPELEKKMDSLLVLREDLQRAIYAAELDGRVIIDEDTGRRTAHHTEGFVTYWVEYERLGGDIQIHNAYRHYMTILEEERL